VVERSDGVRYRVHQGRAGPELPHDAVHFVVEREMEEDGGFWRAIAAGAVFSSMERIAAEGITSLDGVAPTARETLSTLTDARVDEARVIAAAKVLQDAASR
jgi:hypothetical protein